MVDRVLGNRYRLLTKLGGGGMAEVYKGLDTLLDRQVTIKILREQYASDEEFATEFRREAQAVARLSHPNIVSIYDVGIEGETQYLVMEYVDGTNLKEYISEHAPLSQDKLVSIGIQICDALDHAHSNQIVHRDIKPHNILITNTGKVKVTDFGIARAVTEATVKYTGGFMGSVHYLSPEQAKGDITDYKSDIYSAGVVLYEMATGHVPYEGESPITIALKHVQDSPKKPTEINPEISPNLEYVILEAMEREKDKRFSSAKEMKSYVEKLSNDEEFIPREKKNGSSNYNKTKKRLKPAGWVLIILAALGLLVGGFFVISALMSTDETIVPDVIGLRLEQAGINLERERLNVEIGDERYHQDIPKGYVIAQNPRPDSVVREGRVVTLIISMGPRQVEVPNVTGDTFRAATIRIEGANLIVGEVQEAWHDTLPAGRVISQNPLGRTMQDAGTEVDLLVSGGPRLVNIEMPDLRGMAQAEAEGVLREIGLNVGIISHQESNQYFVGQVVSQDVAPGRNIMQGSTVHLTISRGPGPSPEPVAQTTTVTWTVPENEEDGREDHAIRVVVEDVRGAREEYSRRHQPGDNIEISVQFYEQGTIRIYRDGVLVHENSVP